MSDNQFLPNNKPTRIRNLSCVYCGREETHENPFTDEHVIGRRFVPKGSLAKGWALIIQACDQCNKEKADLEDDISATTLHPLRGEKELDPAALSHVQRKARYSVSRITRKPVANSFEEQNIEGRLMEGVTISFGLVSPPRFVPERVRKLAHMHLQAFFYFISYEAGTRKGGFIPGDVGFLSEVSRSDWGNVQMRSFAELTRPWTTTVGGTGANGYFRIIMRREPSGLPVWSFALEWNMSLRVVGFFGDLSVAQRFVDTLSVLDWTPIDAANRFRREIPISEADDILFSTEL